MRLFGICFGLSRLDHDYIIHLSIHYVSYIFYQYFIMEKLDFMVTTVAPGLGFTNKLYFNPEDIKKLKSTKGCVYLARQKQFYGFLPDSRVPVGSVALPQAQLIGLNLQPQVDKLIIDACVRFPNRKGAKFGRFFLKGKGHRPHRRVYPKTFCHSAQSILTSSSLYLL